MSIIRDWLQKVLTNSPESWRQAVGALNTHVIRLLYLYEYH